MKKEEILIAVQIMYLNKLLAEKSKELYDKYNDNLAQLDLYYKHSLENIKREFEYLYETRYKDGYKQAEFDKNKEIIERLGKILRNPKKGK